MYPISALDISALVDVHYKRTSNTKGRNTMNKWFVVLLPFEFVNVNRLETFLVEWTQLGRKSSAVEQMVDDASKGARVVISPAVDLVEAGLWVVRLQERRINCCIIPA